MLVTTQNTAATYAPLCMITGSPIATDSAPTNLASVPSARIITTPPGIFVTSVLNLSSWTYDGTSAVARYWWYDSVYDLWVPHGTTQTMTTATANVINFQVGCMPGAKFFCQITTNTGSVSKIAFTLR